MRFGHVAPDQRFLEGEFELAFEGHGGGHGDHGAWVGEVSTFSIASRPDVCWKRGWRTWSSSERAAHCQLHGQDGVGVAVAHAVAATIERAHIVGCDGLRSCMRRRACEMWLLWYLLGAHLRLAHAWVAC